ncbi:hypothetical protein PPERSA_04859 [Pseudocohnilembus persalinus]|uniref:COP9 signalosome complex subunit 4 n=1 Tax=Pseudocohnilembus persalinus TaxID=266149 RepID=A0A0V0QJ22_PSEPJ|nr:hypothetical protein PPERSA_04859 [Pseudocohnilembus persalinus]|eukprot:KRX02237.1 hypothetical protein PPERSA_04859 [Pseudocohnilembus persalinus]
MNNIGNYINEFEQSLTTTELKKKYEKRLNSLKQQRNNYFWLKANEEDSKKNFLRAAKLYLAFIKELNPNDENIQSNLIQALDQAIICAVLGESGPLRANIVAQIFQDKNIEKSNHRDLLYKTHQNKLITETDKQRLVEQLKSHQKATDNTYQLSQEFTIYEKAITEHNILACTELYESISMKSLSQKLLINEQDTELILQTMINKGSLKASIDQTTSFITFLQSEQMPIDFNERISNFAGKVNDYLEKIAKN